jgi:acyl carrier protein
MGEMQKTKEPIRAFILERFLFSENPEDLADEVSLTGEGIVDSMAALELVTFLEETFGIQVGNDEILPENLDSVDRLAAFVMRKRAGSTEGLRASA